MKDVYSALISIKKAKVYYYYTIYYYIINNMDIKITYPVVLLDFKINYIILSLITFSAIYNQNVPRHLPLWNVIQDRNMNYLLQTW